MIVGIGVDVVSHIRIRGLLQRHGMRVVNRLMHEGEKVLFPGLEHPRAVEFFAARWAAKEAVFKALGKRLDATCIGILRNAKSGAPIVQLDGSVKDRMVARGGHHVWLSMSHDADISCAMVVIEAKNES
jgi:holo-[acyl-carrier protein] synthase